MYKTIINNEIININQPLGMRTSHFIRDHLKLAGSKESCHEGECGACTVLLGSLENDEPRYKAVASCILPIGELINRHVVTIEGLNSSQLNPIQQAIVDEGAAQCGFCTPGFIVSITGFLLNHQQPKLQDALDSLDGNLCRCTGYVSIIRAIKSICEQYSQPADSGQRRLRQLVDWHILPGYFTDINTKLLSLDSSLPKPTPTDQEQEAILIAGATDLFVQKPDELINEKLNFISFQNELTGIRKENNSIYIGAATTIEELRLSTEMNALIPDFNRYLTQFSSTIIRNRATLGGNIFNASPIGDISIILLGVNASLILKSGSIKRIVELKNFFKAYKTLDLQKNEIIAEIVIPLNTANSHFNFEKVARKKILDIASCNSAISLTLDKDLISHIHLAAGGVGPIPLYLHKTCSYLKEKQISAQTVKEAADIAQQEIAPISDVRGSKEYKTLLLRQLLYAHFISLFPDQINLEDLI